MRKAMDHSLCLTGTPVNHKTQIIIAYCHVTEVFISRCLSTMYSNVKSDGTHHGGTVNVFFYDCQVTTTFT